MNSILLSTRIPAFPSKVVEERNKLPNRPPLLIKIAPDLTRKDKEDIAAVILKEKVCSVTSSKYSDRIAYCRSKKVGSGAWSTFLLCRVVQME